MRLSFLGVLGVALLLSGCDNREYFEPQKRYATVAQHTYLSPIVQIGAKGATLENGKFIGSRGISAFALPKGYRFLNESSRYILASHVSGALDLLDKRTGKVVKHISFSLPVVSATELHGTIAYILNNNTFGLYDIKAGKKRFEQHSEATFAINTKAANPLFIDTIVVMPMLDGKLILVDTANPEKRKSIYLSSENALNNIILLSKVGEKLVAATSNRMMVLGDVQKSYCANISEVVLSKNRIFVLTKEGEVVALDFGLKVVERKMFPHAMFVASTYANHRVYALDIKGSLIVLSSDLKRSKIYDVGEVESSVWMANGKLYKDGKIIDLTTLSNE